MDISSYSGNLLASLTLAVFAGIAWLAKNKLKHSKCAVKSRCLECSSQEDDRLTMRNDILEELRQSGVIQGEANV